MRKLLAAWLIVGLAALTSAQAQEKKPDPAAKPEAKPEQKTNDEKLKKVTAELKKRGVELKVDSPDKFTLDAVHEAVSVKRVMPEGFFAKLTFFGVGLSRKPWFYPSIIVLEFIIIVWLMWNRATTPPPGAAGPR